MALRNLLLAIGTIASGYLVIRHLLNRNFKVFTSLLPLAIFFAWILIHFLAFSSNPEAQLEELTGFWLRSFLSVVVGAGFGLAAQQYANEEPQRKFHQNALLIGLSGTLVIYLIRYVYEVAVTGVYLHHNFFMTPFKGKPQIIVFVMMFVAALYAGAGTQKSREALRRWIPLTASGVVLALFVFYTANTKNGFLIFLILTGLFLFSIFAKERLNKINILFIPIILIPIAVFTHKHISSEPAWRNMVADVKVGLDIDNQNYWKNWKDGPTPINELGNNANQSTYLRTAWAAAALRLIRDNPLGYGLMSYSFTYLAQEKWPDFDTKAGRFNVATHSGWIDLTLAFGLPAIVLLLLSLGRSFFLTLGKQDFMNSFARWGIISLVMMYLTVELSFDVFFEFLFFLAAFFSVITANPDEPSTSPRKPRMPRNQAIYPPEK